MDRRSQWLRGVLDLCVLTVLAGEARHGYDIAARLDSAGLGRIRGGTLYPVLGRLADHGLVTASWQPGSRGPQRKYYTLTESGRQMAADGAAAWGGFAARVGALLGTPIETQEG